MPIVRAGTETFGVRDIAGRYLEYPDTRNQKLR